MDESDGEQKPKPPKLSVDASELRLELNKLTPQDPESPQGSPSALRRLLEIITPRRSSPLETALAVYEDQSSKFLQHMHDVLVLLDEHSFASLTQNRHPEFTVLMLISRLKELDGTFIRSLLESRLEDILLEMQRAGEIELVGEGKFLQKKIIAKQADQRARDHHDREQTLVVEELLAMSDLEFLLTLNGFDLPYCNSTNKRSANEIFYGNFLARVVAGDEDFKQLNKNSSHQFQNFEAYRYYSLRESVIALHTIIELFLNTLRCTCQMMEVINLRLQTAVLTIEDQTQLNSKSEQMLENILRWFIDKFKKEEIYESFDPKKLLNTANDVSDDVEVTGDVIEKRKKLDLDNTVTWLSKLDMYATCLQDAIEIYLINCSVYSGKILELQSQHSTEHKKNAVAAHEFTKQFMQFIGEFEVFLNLLQDQDGAYQQMLNSGRQLLEMLEEKQAKTPKRYGQSPRSSPYKGPLTSRSGRSSGNNSPYHLSPQPSPTAKRRSGAGVKWLEILRRMGEENPTLSPDVQMYLSPQPHRVRREDERKTRSADPSPRKQPPGSPQITRDDTSTGTVGYGSKKF